RPLAVLVRATTALARQAVAVEHARASVGKPYCGAEPGCGQADHGDGECGDERSHDAPPCRPRLVSGCYLPRRSNQEGATSVHLRCAWSSLVMRRRFRPLRTETQSDGEAGPNSAGRERATGGCPGPRA